MLDFRDMRTQIAFHQLLVTFIYYPFKAYAKVIKWMNGWSQKWCPSTHSLITFGTPLKKGTGLMSHANHCPNQK